MLLYKTKHIFCNSIRGVGIILKLASNTGWSFYGSICLTLRCAYVVQSFNKKVQRFPNSVAYGEDILAGQ